MLSVDNAAVLAGMVQDLPEKQRSRALRYGIIGAYVLRGASLLAAAWLVKVLWLKIAGGLYLIWLAYQHFTKKETADTSASQTDSKSRFAKVKALLGPFWSTVILVEIMDLAFSIDNVFACVAFTDKIGLIMLGVFIGILAMRFVAVTMVRLIERYPVLNTITFIVIGLLGIKLTMTGIGDYLPGNPVSPVLNSHITDIVFSLLITLLFLVPVFSRKRGKQPGSGE